MEKVYSLVTARGVRWTSTAGIPSELQVLQYWILMGSLRKPILGEPGATSRDDAIVLGESLL